jgi:RimJ/RimL family protein N-acetyltransferase
VPRGPGACPVGHIEESMVEIRTERLRLRPATPADLHAIHAVLGDPRAMAYWSTPPHAGLQQTRAWLQGMIEIPTGEGEDFVVEHAGRVIGKAGLYRFPEIGFILHPDCWGKGLAAEALRVVLDRAFTVHGLDRVEADVDPRNDASLRLLGRLAFRETGRRERTWLIDGHWCDSVYLRLAAGDWRACNGLAR